MAEDDLGPEQVLTEVLEYLTTLRRLTTKEEVWAFLQAADPPAPDPTSTLHARVYLARHRLRAGLYHPPA